VSQRLCGKKLISTKTRENDDFGSVCGITIGGRHREALADIGTYSRKFAGPNVNRAPQGAGARQQTPIAGPHYLSMPLKCAIRGCADPGPGNDRVAQARGMFIVYFVSDNEPGNIGLLRSSGSCPPVCCRSLLDPTHINDIVYVSMFVNVGRTDLNRHIEPFKRWISTQTINFLS
jgi:hypothetical protein